MNFSDGLSSEGCETVYLFLRKVPSTGAVSSTMWPSFAYTLR